jgi:hypothetical protein
MARDPSGNIFAFGRYLPPPYRIVRRGPSVSVGRQVVFSTAPAPQTRLRDPRARFMARIAKDFDAWRLDGGLPFAQSKLASLLRARTDVRAFEIYGGGVMLTFTDGTREEVLLQRPTPPPRRTDEAEAFKDRLTEALALACTLLIGEGYLVSVPASAVDGRRRRRLLSIARSRQSQAEREAGLLEVVGEQTMAGVVRGR